MNDEPDIKLTFLGKNYPFTLGQIIQIAEGGEHPCQYSAQLVDIKSDGKALPTPLLAYGIQHNPSNKEDNGSK